MAADGAEVGGARADAEVAGTPWEQDPALENDFELLIIGAGPAGIALAAEGRVAGVRPGGILVLERATEHSWIIRKYYPPSKPVLATFQREPGWPDVSHPPRPAGEPVKRKSPIAVWRR